MANYIGPYDYEDAPAPPDSRWTARRHLAEAMRRLNELSVISTADADALNAICETINRQADKLAQYPVEKGKLAQMDADKDTITERRIVSHEISPLTGFSNPVSPPMNTWFDGDEVKARVTMGWQYEGPPGCVHGGFIAALFDDFLGVGQKLTGQPGFTGTLKVRYIKPTPLGEELTLIGRVKSIEGRVNTLSGEMYAGDTLTASSEGLFVHMPADYLAKLKAQKNTQ